MVKLITYKSLGRGELAPFTYLELSSGYYNDKKMTKVGGNSMLVTFLCERD